VVSGGAKFGVFEGSFRVPALVHSPLLPPEVVGKSCDETIYVGDWYVCLSVSSQIDGRPTWRLVRRYVTFALLGGVDARKLGSTGPVPPVSQTVAPGSTDKIARSLN
jgi:hypothetical protein